VSTIYQEGEVWYYQWYVHGKKWKKSMRTADKSQAKRLQKRWDAELEARALGLAPARVSIADALERCLHRRGPRLRPGSLVRYQEISRILLEDLKCEWVNSLTADHLADFIRLRRGKGRAPRTVADEMQLLKGAILDLYRDGMIPEIPVKAWPTLKVPPARPDRRGAYSEADVAAMQDHFADHPFGRIFRFTLFTGVRRGEVHLLQWKDLDLARGVASIRSEKTATSAADQFRLFPLHQAILEELRAREPGRPNELIFPEIKNHSRNWPHNQMQVACKKLGIQYRRFHGLRHTTASYLLAAGASLIDVMDLMGWTQVETAQGYLHLTETSHAAVAKLPWGGKENPPAKARGRRSPGGKVPGDRSETVE